MKEQGSIRLADRIITGGQWHLPDTALASAIEAGVRSFVKDLRLAPVFLAQNIADYCNGKNQEEWGWGDFPCLMPPFERFWIEWQGWQWAHGARAEGAMFSTTTVTGHEIRARAIATVLNAEALDFSLLDLHREYKQCEIFIVKEMRKRDFIPVGGAIFFLTTDGTLLAEMAMLNPFWFTPDELTPQQAANAMLSAITPALVTVSFLNCKNIRIRTMQPPEKLSRAFKSRHRLPLLKYHVLEIEPMKQVLESEGNIGHNGLKKALHICRGHFATYTPDAPLFGRVTGTFWKPAHVRGSLNEGAVVKDYAVKAPS